MKCLNKFLSAKLAFSLSFFFLLSIIVQDISLCGLVYASELALPAPNMILKASREFSEPVLRGLRLDKQNPYKFEFIIDTQNMDNVSKTEVETLVKYFLAGLSVSKDKLWVNLSPYEKDRIIDDKLEKTELGKDILMQDYILKQFSSSLTNPATDLGKKYWDLLNNSDFAQSAALLNKIWISPDKTEVYQKNDVVLITKASLKVDTEKDYVENATNNVELGNELRSIILPKISQEVNQGNSFTKLRQIYHSLILAQWFKQSFMNSVYKEYFNSESSSAIAHDDEMMKKQVFDSYVKSFEDGVYNSILKERTDENKLIKRQYFSGGATMSMAIKAHYELPGEFSDVDDLNTGASAIAEVNVSSSSIDAKTKMKLNHIRNFVKDTLLDKDMLLALSGKDLLDEMLDVLKYVNKGNSEIVEKIDSLSETLDDTIDQNQINFDLDSLIGDVEFVEARVSENEDIKKLENIIISIVIANFELPNWAVKSLRDLKSKREEKTFSDYSDGEKDAFINILLDNYLKTGDNSLRQFNLDKSLLDDNMQVLLDLSVNINLLIESETENSFILGDLMVKQIIFVLLDRLEIQPKNLDINNDEFVLDKIKESNLKTFLSLYDRLTEIDKVLVRRRLSFDIDQLREQLNKDEKVDEDKKVDEDESNGDDIDYDLNLPDIVIMNKGEAEETIDIKKIIEKYNPDEAFDIFGQIISNESGRRTKYKGLVVIKALATEFPDAFFNISANELMAWSGAPGIAANVAELRDRFNPEFGLAEEYHLLGFERKDIVKAHKFIDQIIMRSMHNNEFGFDYDYKNRKNMESQFRDLGYINEVKSDAKSYNGVYSLYEVTNKLSLILLNKFLNEDFNGNFKPLNNEYAYIDYDGADTSPILFTNILDLLREYDRDKDNKGRIIRFFPKADVVFSKIRYLLAKLDSEQIKIFNQNYGVSVDVILSAFDNVSLAPSDLHIKSSRVNIEFIQRDSNSSIIDFKKLMKNYRADILYELFPDAIMHNTTKTNKGLAVLRMLAQTYPDANFNISVEELSEWSGASRSRIYHGDLRSRLGYQSKKENVQSIYNNVAEFPNETKDTLMAVLIDAIINTGDIDNFNVDKKTLPEELKSIFNLMIREDYLIKLSSNNDYALGHDIPLQLLAKFVKIYNQEENTYHDHETLRKLLSDFEERSIYKTNYRLAQNNGKKSIVIFKEFEENLGTDNLDVDDADTVDDKKGDAGQELVQQDPFEIKESQISVRVLNYGSYNETIDIRGLIGSVKPIQAYNGLDDKYKTTKAKAHPGINFLRTLHKLYPNATFNISRHEALDWSGASEHQIDSLGLSSHMDQSVDLLKEYRIQGIKANQHETYEAFKNIFEIYLKDNLLRDIYEPGRLGKLIKMFSDAGYLKYDGTMQRHFISPKLAIMMAAKILNNDFRKTFSPKGGQLAYIKNDKSDKVEIFNSYSNLIKRYNVLIAAKQKITVYIHPKARKVMNSLSTLLASFKDGQYELLSRDFGIDKSDTASLLKHKNDNNGVVELSKIMANYKNAQDYLNKTWPVELKSVVAGKQAGIRVLHNLNVLYPNSVFDVHLADALKWADVRESALANYPELIPMFGSVEYAKSVSTSSASNNKEDIAETTIDLKDRLDSLTSEYEIKTEDISAVKSFMGRKDFAQIIKKERFYLDPAKFISKGMINRNMVNQVDKFGKEYQLSALCVVVIAKILLTQKSISRDPYGFLISQDSEESITSLLELLNLAAKSNKTNDQSTIILTAKGRLNVDLLNDLFANIPAAIDLRDKLIFYRGQESQKGVFDFYKKQEVVPVEILLKNKSNGIKHPLASIPLNVETFIKSKLKTSGKLAYLHYLLMLYGENITISKESLAQNLDISETDIDEFIVKSYPKLLNRLSAEANTETIKTDLSKDEKTADSSAKVKSLRTMSKPSLSGLILKADLVKINDAVSAYDLEKSLDGHYSLEATINILEKQKIVTFDLMSQTIKFTEEGIVQLLKFVFNSDHYLLAYSKDDRMTPITNLLDLYSHLFGDGSSVRNSREKSFVLTPWGKQVLDFIQGLDKSLSNELEDINKSIVFETFNNNLDLSNFSLEDNLDDLKAIVDQLDMDGNHKYDFANSDLESKLLLVLESYDHSKLISLEQIIKLYPEAEHMQLLKDYFQRTKVVKYTGTTVAATNKEDSIKSTEQELVENEFRTFINSLMDGQVVSPQSFIDLLMGDMNSEDNHISVKDFQLGMKLLERNIPRLVKETHGDKVISYFSEYLYHSDLADEFKILILGGLNHWLSVKEYDEREIITKYSNLLQEMEKGSDIAVTTLSRLKDMTKRTQYAKSMYNHLVEKYGEDVRASSSLGTVEAMNFFEHIAAEVRNGQMDLNEAHKISERERHIYLAHVFTHKAYIGDTLSEVLKDNDWERVFSSIPRTMMGVYPDGMAKEVITARYLLALYGNQVDISFLNLSLWLGYHPNSLARGLTGFDKNILNKFKADQLDSDRAKSFDLSKLNDLAAQQRLFYEFEAYARADFAKFLTSDLGSVLAGRSIDFETILKHRKKLGNSLWGAIKGVKLKEADRDKGINTEIVKVYRGIDESLRELLSAGVSEKVAVVKYLLILYFDQIDINIEELSEWSGLPQYQIQNLILKNYPIILDQLLKNSKQNFSRTKFALLMSKVKYIGDKERLKFKESIQETMKNEYGLNERLLQKFRGHTNHRVLDLFSSQKEFTLDKFTTEFIELLQDNECLETFDGKKYSLSKKGMMIIVYHLLFTDNDLDEPVAFAFDAKGVEYSFHSLFDILNFAAWAKKSEEEQINIPLTSYGARMLNYIHMFVSNVDEDSNVQRYINLTTFNEEVKGLAKGTVIAESVSQTIDFKDFFDNYGYSIFADDQLNADINEANYNKYHISSMPLIVDQFLNFKYSKRQRTKFLHYIFMTHQAASDLSLNILANRLSMNIDSLIEFINTFYPSYKYLIDAYNDNTVKKTKTPNLSKQASTDAYSELNFMEFDDLVIELYSEYLREGPTMLSKTTDGPQIITSLVDGVNNSGFDMEMRLIALDLLNYWLSSKAYEEEEITDVYDEIFTNLKKGSEFTHEIVTRFKSFGFDINNQFLNQYVEMGYTSTKTTNQKITDNNTSESKIDGGVDFEFDLEANSFKLPDAWQASNAVDLSDIDFAVSSLYPVSSLAEHLQI